MKLNKSLLLIGFASLAFSSCIKEEAPNAEADIEYVLLEDVNGNFLVRKNDTIVSVGTDAISNHISVMVHPEADLSSVTPRFKLTEGASIAIKNGIEFDPEVGVPLNFSESQTFVVTSEDGRWQKEYELSFKTVAIFTKFSFEHVEKPANALYDHFFETLGNRRYDIWATGNPGYQFCGLTSYPTVSNNFGVAGKSVCLRTASTGGFGLQLNMAIAAGNLFIGSFDVTNATSAPREATRFGSPFNKVPKRFTGWYKYKPGDVMTDEKGKPIGGEDRPDIYIVMYRNAVDVDGVEHGITLDGDNILSSENIVGMARIKDVVKVNPGEDINKAEWQRFDLEFELDRGKSIDRNILENYGYNLAVVFTSSVDGAYFRGAVGSTLYVDEVEVVCE